MGTTAQKLQAIIDAKTSIKKSINDMGVTVADTDTLATYASKIAQINTQQPGYFNVRFMDIDGRILKNQLVAMGSNAIAPNVESTPLLNFVGWNGNFANIQWDRYIGASYNTDGRTLLYVSIGPSGTWMPTLCLTSYANTDITINWGDGPDTDTINSVGVKNISHQYGTEGDFLITISGANNSYALGDGITAVFGADSYILTKAYLGNVANTLLSNCFLQCVNLAVISVGTAVTSVGAMAFKQCNSLSCIHLPAQVVSVGVSAFNSCRNLKIATFPASVSALGTNIFEWCTRLEVFEIPQGIPNIPVSTFISCYNLKYVQIRNNISVLKLNSFQSTISLERIELPASTTQIEATVFNDCRILKEIVIKAITPPVISSSTFVGLNKLSRIYVPQASVGAYRSATNWNLIANNIYPII